MSQATDWDLCELLGAPPSRMGRQPQSQEALEMVTQAGWANLVSPGHVKSHLKQGEEETVRTPRIYFGKR